MESEIKIKLHQQAIELANQRVDELKAALVDVQDAANNETKSSAGDKHETARAMAQLETEKLSNQLNEAIKLAQTLNQINPKNESTQAGLGSLVFTNNGKFYLSVSLGKLLLEGETYFLISTSSPIGNLLQTKKEKQNFSFNGVVYVIEKII